MASDRLDFVFARLATETMSARAIMLPMVRMKGVGALVHGV
jgi:hypothetical protein